MEGAVAVRFMVFDRWGGYQHDLVGVVEAEHRQQVNSTDELDVSVPVALSKGDRILWNDGEWHEHVVNELDQEHSDGQTMAYVCESSLQWLRYRKIRLFSMKNVTAAEALSHVLEGTVWDVGEVDDFGRRDLVLEQTDVYKAVLEIAGTWGCEIRADVGVTHSGANRRSVSLVKRVGESRGVRFEYGRDIEGVEKTILSDDVITACYGYGCSLEGETDGVKNRLWVYVEGTEEQKSRWGQSDGKGGKVHSEGSFEDSQVKDRAELERRTREYLAQHSAPSVSYKVKGVPAMQMRGVRLGDSVQVVDREFVPELRIEARVGELRRDLLTGETKECSFGTVASVLPDVLTRIYRQVSAVAPAMGTAESAASLAAIADEKATNADKKASDIGKMLTDGQLSIGGSVLKVEKGKIFLDDRELALKGV